MDQTPLVIDEIEAGKAFIERLHSYAPVIAAWWMRNDDGGRRYLYVAIDGLQPGGNGPVYDEVYRVTQEMRDHNIDYIDPFRVKVVGMYDPVAKAVVDLYRRFPGRIPRFAGRSLGGVGVAEIYIYPPPREKPQTTGPAVPAGHTLSE
jgi:hypothetical protein